MTHHQEIFTELDLTLAPDYQDRHKTSEDGETRLFDNRCQWCRWIRAQAAQLNGSMLSEEALYEIFDKEAGSAGRTEQ